MIRPLHNAEKGNKGPQPIFDLETTVHDVEIVGLPPDMVGKTFLQLSDFHRGCGDTDALIYETVRRANALDPDYIVLTGDFVNRNQHDILPIVKMVSGLRARSGIFAVLGNHDHRGDPVLLHSALEAAGIRMLNNTALCLTEGFWIAGVDDLYEGIPDLEAALSPVPDTAALLLLSHHPGTLDLVDPDRPLLILSGHTHGGQIVLPFPSPEMICWWHLRTRYVHGWFRNRAVQLYVNRGIGVTGSWLTARRFHCPSEITLFRLRAAG